MKRAYAAPILLMLAVSVAAFAAEAQLRTISSQPSWVIRTPQVELAVTQLGGHMAPVTFFRDSRRPVQPYHVSPWQDEKLSIDVPVLVPLRGDFFCMPFGGNADAYNGEKHPPHGEVAGSSWTSAGTKTEGGVTTLTLTMDTTVRKGKVTKELSLVDGQNVVYSQHRIEGFAGKAPLGHHATLAVPEKEGSLRIATSPFKFGLTCPAPFSDPRQGEYQSLQIGARFQNLNKVPVMFKGQPDADCTSFPARTGFADLLAVFSRPTANQPAWIAVTCQDQGYVWFALKDPAVLPSTVFWIENHGRHASPWNGRNRCLGLEDVCAHFADGLVPSARENILTKEGIPTAIELRADRPTTVRYIQGVARIPDGFDNVRTLEFGADQVTFVSTTGKHIDAPVRHGFLRTGKL